MAHEEPPSDVDEDQGEELAGQEVDVGDPDGDGRKDGRAGCDAQLRGLQAELERVRELEALLQRQKEREEILRRATEESGSV